MEENKKQFNLSWNPKEDITAYELAKIVPILTGMVIISPEEVESNPSHLRHFDVTEVKPTLSIVKTAKKNGKRK